MLFGTLPSHQKIPALRIRWETIWGIDGNAFSNDQWASRSRLRLATTGGHPVGLYYKCLQIVSRNKEGLLLIYKEPAWEFKTVLCRFRATKLLDYVTISDYLTYTTDTASWFQNGHIHIGSHISLRCSQITKYGTRLWAVSSYAQEVRDLWKSLRMQEMKQKPHLYAHKE